MLNYNGRIILTEQYFTTGQQPEWTNLINKESCTTYYNTPLWLQPLEWIYYLTKPLNLDTRLPCLVLPCSPNWLMEVLNCLCVYTLGQSNQRLLHWLPWRKNVGSMGSHTSTEQIMQLAAVSSSWVGDKQIRIMPLCPLPKNHSSKSARVMARWSHAYI